jgi:hypothetical protein
MREQGTTTGFGSIDQISLTSGMYVTEERQAKLYLLVVFCFLDSKGQAIWTPTIYGKSTTSGGVTTTPIISFGNYHWELFTDNGEAPHENLELTKVTIKEDCMSAIAEALLKKTPKA